MKAFLYKRKPHKIKISDNNNIKKICRTYMMDISIDYCHVKEGTITKYRWLKDFLKTGCQLNFNWKDPMPTLCYYWNKISSKF